LKATTIYTSHHSFLVMPLGSFILRSTALGLNIEKRHKLVSCLFKTFFYNSHIQKNTWFCGSGTVRRRGVSTMVVPNALYEKKCVFEIFEKLDYKGCLLILNQSPKPKP